MLKSAPINDCIKALLPLRWDDLVKVMYQRGSLIIRDITRFHLFGAKRLGECIKPLGRSEQSLMKFGFSLRRRPGAVLSEDFFDSFRADQHMLTPQSQGPVETDPSLPCLD